MKNKVGLVLTIIFILCLGIGGKLFMDKKEEKANQILDAEKAIALYLVQKYEGVEKIEFSEFNQTLATGSWHVSVKVNNDNLITFSTFDLTNPDDLGIRYNPETFHLKGKSEKDNEDLEDIEIIYSEEK